MQQKIIEWYLEAMHYTLILAKKYSTPQGLGASNQELFSLPTECSSTCQIRRVRRMCWLPPHGQVRGGALW